MSPPAAETPFIGRDGLLADVVELAQSRPGAIMLWGEVGVGRRRLAREVAARLGAGVVRVYVAPGPEPLIERVRGALVELELGQTLQAAGRAAQFVALIDDADTSEYELLPVREALEQSRGLVIAAGRQAAVGVACRGVTPLETDRAAELAITTCPELSAEQIKKITALADGLPRLIMALAQATAAGTHGKLQIPPALSRLALSDLVDLPDDGQDLVRWIALTRDRVEPDVLAVLTSLPPGRVQDQIDELVALGQVTQKPGHNGGLAFGLRRSLTGAALIAGMGPNELRRRSRDLLVAGRQAAWPSAVLAEIAGDAGEHAAAIEFAFKGAEEARALNDVGESLRLIDLVLGYWRPEHGELIRARAYREAAYAHQSLCQDPEAADYFERAADGLRTEHDQAAAFEAAVSAAFVNWNRNERRRGYNKLTAFINSSDGTPSPGRTEALLGQATLAAGLSLNSSLRETTLRVLNEGPATGVGRARSRSIALFGYGRSGETGTAAGLRYLDHAREIALGAHDTRTASITLGWTSHLLVSLGHPAAARDTALENFEFAKANLLTDHATVAIGNVGEAYLGLGKLAEARSWLERAANGWRILESSRPTASDAGEGWLLIQEGRIAEALDHFRPLERACNPAGMVFHELSLIAAGHATAALEAGEVNEARRVVEQALAVWHTNDDQLFVAPLLVAAAGCDGDLARSGVDALVEMARLGADHAPMWRDMAIGLHAVSANPDRAVKAFQDAKTRFESRGLAWWAVRAQLAAGIAGGESDGAADDLLAARASFSDMDAGPWRQRAEAALRGIGRRIPSRGSDKRATVGDLSSREVEVLQQLMAGLSNREIGERLYIAERTVARHLAGIFSKLGVNNRAAAVAAATERGIAPASEAALSEA